jgi:hypothetical protein
MGLFSSGENSHYASADEVRTNARFEAASSALGGIRCHKDKDSRLKGNLIFGPQFMAEELTVEADRISLFCKGVRLSTGNFSGNSLNRWSTG